MFMFCFAKCDSIINSIVYFLLLMFPVCQGGFGAPISPSLSHIYMYYIYSLFMFADGQGGLGASP